MFLLIGFPDDPCLLAVRDALIKNNAAVSVVDSPFVHPARATWRFDDHESTFQWRPHPAARPVPIHGVLARGLGTAAAPLPDASGWQAEDIAYARAEAEAAMLGWLTGAPFPVIDRLPAWAWYGSRAPIFGWGATLARCGLPPLDAVATNDPTAIAALLARQGAAWMPLSGGGTRYLAGPAETQSLIEIARGTPLCLTSLHSGAGRACVLAARQVVWDDDTPPEITALEPRLLAFASIEGLACVELVLAMGPADTVRTVDVSPYPRFGAFAPAPRAVIATALADFLLQGAQL